MHRPKRAAVAAVQGSEGKKPDSTAEPSQANAQGFQWASILANLGPCIAYAVLLYYCSQLAPNQTPTRDVYLIKQLVGLIGAGDGLARINTVVFDLFYLMGVYPCIYASLLIPAARSSNMPRISLCMLLVPVVLLMKVPIWPFSFLSFFVGVFALFPYLCLWQPRDDKTAPPAAEELENGASGVGLRVLESTWFPVFILLSAVGLLASAFIAGIPEWNGYIQYFDESRFVHVMSLDFTALTVLMPFFMWWDADKREWPQRAVGVPLLSLLPLVGPAIYLIMRPKARRV